MTTWILAKLTLVLDQGPNALELLLMKILAVLGGAALGALATGLVAARISHSLVGKEITPGPLRYSRLLGALAAGGITASLLFGPGGGIGSGGGGWGVSGGGPGPGGGKKASVEPVSTTPEPQAAVGKASKHEEKKDKPAPALRIEILGDSRVEKEHYYRLEGELTLRTLRDIQGVLETRRKGVPPLEQVVLVIYTNSPDEQKHQVTALKTLAEDLGLAVGKDLPPREAP